MTLGNRTTEEAMTKELWSGENGRIVCRDHAGMTARASNMKRDLGGPMHRITIADIHEWPTDELGPIACETCGAEASVVR